MTLITTCMSAFEPRQRALIVSMVCATVLSASAALAVRAVDAEMPRGKVVYELHCARCHGSTGLGDGPRAGELNVRPTNFQDPAFQSRTDEQVLRGIEFCELRSPMHAWRDRLTAEEMRDVRAYIREFGRGSRSSAERP